jgi:alcohol dehydrogenase class IV
MKNLAFSAANFPVRIHSGPEALDQLPAEIVRLRAQRVFVFCGNSVAHRTPLIHLIRDILGDSVAGVFDRIDKDASLASVLAATDAARNAQADLLLAVGAGSVIKAVRIIAMLLAENKPPEELMTYYPPGGGAAISRKLHAPKLPIINVLTAPTNAQNRAGAALKNAGLDHRMEFFDPKTRPVAVFWDARALATAPREMNRHTGVTVFWLSLMGMGGLDAANVLVHGDRRQAYRLAHQALPRMGDDNDLEARIEMCAAAFLQNREEQDGSPSTHRVHWPSRVVYGLGSSLFNLFPHMSQGESYTTITAAAIRCFGERDPHAMAAMGQALDGKERSAGAVDGHLEVADAVEAYFSKLGYAVRLRDVGVTRERLPEVVEFSTKNFNADPKREFLAERALLLKTLEMAW